MVKKVTGEDITERNLNLNFQRFIFYCEKVYSTFAKNIKLMFYCKPSFIVRILLYD